MQFVFQIQYRNDVRLCFVMTKHGFVLIILDTRQEIRNGTQRRSFVSFFAGYITNTLLSISLHDTESRIQFQ